MTENKTNSTKEGFKVYELGIHLLPTLSEADVQVEFSKIKSQIEKLQGEFISESAPRLFNLAYEIPKTIKAVKRWYETAYFGWVKFELEAKELAAFEKFVKELDNTLRYLLVKTVREDTIVSPDLLANDVVIAEDANAQKDVVAETSPEVPAETETL
jgi:ribosomal protein S6